LITRSNYTSEGGEENMPRRASKPISLFIDDKPASFKSIAKDRGSDVWKSFIESNPRCKKEANEYLTQQLGKYLDASEIRKLSGIEPKELNRWRKDGLLTGVKFKGKWYYSKSSVAMAINKS
jgi:hypothetical protein